MIGKAQRRFWKAFHALPPHAQKLAREKFALWKRASYHPSLQFRCAVQADSSHLAALGLQVHHPMAGLFFALAQVVKKAVNVVPASIREFVFNTPDFLEHHVASRLGGLDVSCFAHR